MGNMSQGLSDFLVQSGNGGVTAAVYPSLEEDVSLLNPPSNGRVNTDARGQGFSTKGWSISGGFLFFSGVLCQRSFLQPAQEAK